MIKLLVSSLAVLLMRAENIHGEVVTADVQLRGVSGQLRYFYDDAEPSSCDSVMLLGVGTAMSVRDYDLVSSEIVSGNSVVNIVVDHSPRWFVKTSSRGYANFVNAIAEQITEIVPACKSSPKNGFIVGGHSAGGQAALGALPSLSFSPAGFFGLDPFRIDPRRANIDLPAMFWGLSETTCRVDVNLAAKGGYQASSVDQRVLYQIQNPSGGVSHCAFTDSGCFGAICPSSGSDSMVRASVGESAKKFVGAIASGDFAGTNFDVNESNVQVFVNEDQTGDRVRSLRGATHAERDSAFVGA